MKSAFAWPLKLTAALDEKPGTSPACHGGGTWRTGIITLFVMLDRVVGERKMMMMREWNNRGE